MQDPWFLKDHSPLDLEIQDLAFVMLKIQVLLFIILFGLPNIANLRFGLSNIEYSEGFGNSRYLACQLLKIQTLEIQYLACPRIQDLARQILKVQDLEVMNGKCKTLQEGFLASC